MREFPALGTGTMGDKGVQGDGEEGYSRPGGRGCTGLGEEGYRVRKKKG